MSNDQQQNQDLGQDHDQDQDQDDSRSFDPRTFEPKWREYWHEQGLDRTPENPSNKFYMLEMFAYPSGDIHMGHFRNYTIGDVVARYQKMLGKDVLHPFGWDAFGLPAENAAIKHGIQPGEWTLSNIEKSRSSLQQMGISYDWDRELVTCREDYYKHTQWMFLLLYERGLAYRRNAEVNWCPIDQTVLANEHVVGGCCWRHPDTPVEKRTLEQWFFRITDYADRLLDNLDQLDQWPEGTVKQQRSWIGRSEGAEIDYRLEGLAESDTLTVFTTRPDTLWGATFLVLAPEHPLTARLTTDSQREEVEAYVAQARSKTEIERMDATRDKDGVFSGSYAKHPVTGEAVPIWVADYVLAGYGTGSIMGVPAHDQRDFEFARKYDLEVRVVVQPEGARLDGATLDEAAPGTGKLVASPPFDGTEVPQGIPDVIRYLEEQGVGRGKIQYRLRDWLISRQRYWGCPIPMIHCDQCGVVPVPLDQLPVELPKNVENFVPSGRSPLEDVKEFFEVECPQCGGAAHRDADTMDTFVDSSWYHLRFLDPHNTEEPFDRAEAAKWLPVDYYIGGDEHATGHLLYFRFFTQVLHDAGWLDIEEPVVRLFHHGMVMDDKGEVMSKSKGNVVAPAELFARDGVDIPRLAMLFFAPSADEILWNEKGIDGVRRFVQRLWSLFEETVADARYAAAGEVRPDALSAEAKEGRRLLHWAVERTETSLEGDLNFNTAIAAFMEMMNALRKVGAPATWSDDDFPVLAEAVKMTSRAMAPLAPHLSEEIWHRAGGAESVFIAGWPTVDPEALKRDEVEIPVQFNGKLRVRLHLSPKATREEMEIAALADVRVQEILDGQEPKRVIVVPGRLVNLVV
ncbi:MAG: leucine--tRNA ligase [Thermoanaerobaculia bacterium]|nr:leucine--tRNA ligase [Thermoanaerobaculia bacterium]